MNWMRKILDFFFPLTVDEQKKRYIKKHGYPKESVVFCDVYGGMGQIVGRDLLIRTAEKIRKMSLGVIIWDINTGEVFCRKCGIVVKESSEIEKGECRMCFCNRKNK